MRPCLERKRREDPGAGHMVFKTAALLRRQRVFLAMKKTHQVAFTIFRDAISQDEIVHPPANVERIDLNISVVQQRSLDVAMRLIEAEHVTDKPTSSDGIELNSGG